MKYYVTILITIFFFGAQSCKPKTLNEKIYEASQDKDINAGKLNFTFTLPEDWYRYDTTIQNLKITFLYNPNDTYYNPRINVLSERMEHLIHSEYMYFARREAGYGDAFEQGQFDVYGYECLWETYNSKDETSGITRELIFYSIKSGEISYNITAGFNTGGRAHYKATVDNIVKSFRFVYD